MSIFETLTIAKAALEEDGVGNDITTRLLGKKAETEGRAVIVAKQSGVFSGKLICEAIEKSVGNLKIELLVSEGSTFKKGDKILSMEAMNGTILSVERVILNFLSHLCGVATLTRRFVELARPAKILATRKTTPGLRQLELQAVSAGGGSVYRRSLSAAILIKENHQALLPLKELVAAATSYPIEVEVQNLEELKEAVNLPVSIIMLDNFKLSDVKRAVELVAGKIPLEVSGGVTLETVSDLGKTGVAFISVGSLTHSAQAIDLSLDLV